VVMYGSVVIVPIALSHIRDMYPCRCLADRVPYHPHRRAAGRAGSRRRIADE